LKLPKTYDGKADLVIRVTPTDKDLSQNPDVFISTKIENPTSSNNEMACSMQGEELCILNNHFLSPEKDVFIAV
jgi:hypothetical protein